MPEGQDMSSKRKSDGIIGRFYVIFGLRDAENELQRAKREEVLFELMENTISKKSLYLNKSLSADTLARELGTNRLYLNRMLHNRGLRFTSYINTFRLQKAIQILSMPENKDMSIDEVALRSGFTSDRTMNYYVLKMMGVTAVVLKRRFDNMQPEH